VRNAVKAFRETRKRSVSSVQERTSPDGTITIRSRHAGAGVRPDMPGTLFVVATPIGNLEDITLRALRVLGEVDLIAAEDTRRTARLLSAHAISTRTVSFHQHNAHARVPQLLARLRGGESVALVTDAGTPGISDPGVELVSACVESSVKVDPVPGVSAPLAAAVASGFPLNPLTIYGFAPIRSNDRKRWLQNVGKLPHTSTFFEAPHRVKAMLGDAGSILGNRQIMVAREVTKVHQEFLYGSASAVEQQLSAAPKGEITVVIGPLTEDDVTNSLSSGPTDDQVARLFGQLTETGLSRREALTATAKQLGIPSRSAYAAVERVKNM
jgi:16S rRNA (cytidine1402-2'-O)-methyltransferase